jgi:hypothetical protein
MKWLQDRSPQNDMKLAEQGDICHDEDATGFVLAEAVVAITIATLGVGAALLALRQGQLLQVETLKRTAALVICEERLRQAMAQTSIISHTRTQNIEGGFVVKTTYAPSSSIMTLDGKPYYSASTSVPIQGAQKFTRLQTQVSWRDTRRERQLALEVIIPVTDEPVP